MVQGTDLILQLMPPGLRGKVDFKHLLTNDVCLPIHFYWYLLRSCISASLKAFRVSLSVSSAINFFQSKNNESNFFRFDKFIHIKLIFTCAGVFSRKRFSVASRKFLSWNRAGQAGNTILIRMLKKSSGISELSSPLITISKRDRNFSRCSAYSLN